VDVQGPDVVKPYAEKFGVTFPLAVDPADLFGQTFDLTAIPVSYLIDEVGIVRLCGGGPSDEFLEQIESLLAEPVSTSRGVGSPLPETMDPADLQHQLSVAPTKWRIRLALARSLWGEGKSTEAIEQCRIAATHRPDEASIHFTWGQILIHADQRTAGLEQLEYARNLDPDNWRIRKQIWAIENPEKFYAGDSPDYGWQKDELAREKSARE